MAIAVSRTPWFSLLSHRSKATVSPGTTAAATTTDPPGTATVKQQRRPRSVDEFFGDKSGNGYNSGSGGPVCSGRLGGGRTLVVVERSRGDPGDCPAPPDPISGPCGVMWEVGRVELADPPHNLAARRALVFATHPTKRLTRLDLSTGETTTVEVGTEPHDVDFSNDGTRLFVTDEKGRSLIVLDPNSLDRIGEVALPGPGHDSAVAERGIWMTLVGSNELALITRSTVELIPTGASPHDLLVDAAGMVWFSNWHSASIMLFDPDGYDHGCSCRGERATSLPIRHRGRGLGLRQQRCLRGRIRTERASSDEIR